MADEEIHSFEVKNDDVRIRFSCISTASCISRAMKNMRATSDGGVCDPGQRSAFFL